MSPMSGGKSVYVRCWLGIRSFVKRTRLSKGVLSAVQVNGKSKIQSSWHCLQRELAVARAASVDHGGRHREVLAGSKWPSKLFKTLMQVAGEPKQCVQKLPGARRMDPSTLSPYLIPKPLNREPFQRIP